MSTLTQPPSELASGFQQKQPTNSRHSHKAWVAKAAKEPMVLEAVDLGPLGAEDVEVTVEHDDAMRLLP